ncbi:MAG: S8 family serine peptidase [Pseudoalteromonas prydzensis]|uniref:S8 family serine peptidase n=1 Tax=Pseudoalteromonas prydzensis TaxID=182141 RepID=UPI003F9D3BC0
MSKNIMKRTAIATAVSSALLAGFVSAAELPKAKAKFSSQTVEAINQVTNKKIEPTAYMIVLRATTAVDVMAAGTYQQTDSYALMQQVEQLQRVMTVELNNLDFNAKIIGKTKVLAPTLIVQASQNALAQIAKDPRVAKVLPMYDDELHVKASADYLKASQFVSDGTLTGSTQKVAVLDTGIDYTHKVFGGEGTVAAYLAAQADPTTVSWPQGQVKGGYDFMRDDADPIENDPETPTEEDAPTSHGTSVSHSVTGIAPKVELYVYSVCGGGCPGAAQAAALEAAMDPNSDGNIVDRVDVINMSLGGEFGSTSAESGTQYLIQRAVDLGVNVVISAGNDGDNPFRVGGPSTTPNALSVGAMTHPTKEQGQAEVTLAGEEITVQTASFGPQDAYEEVLELGEIIYPESNALACDKFAEEVDFTGKAVLVDRGVCNFTDKVLNAQEKGATFVIVANNVDDGTPPGMGGSDERVTIHSIGVDFATGAEIKGGIANSSQAQLIAKVVMNKVAGAVIDFSSRGPSMDGLLKPEITAPGSMIDVAATGTQDKLAPASGTSFSGPITAGAVALVREAHPERNALEIKATLMNTADLNVTVDPLTIDPDSPLAPISLIGAGLVDVEKAVNSPVAAWVQYNDFNTKQAALSFGLINLTETSSFTKTVTVKNFSLDEKTYKLRTQARYQNDEDTAAISWDMPESITVAAGATTNFDVTLTIDPAKLPEWELVNPFDLDDIAQRSAALTLVEFDGAVIFDDVATESDHDLHLVYHVMPKAIAAVNIAPEVIDNEMVLVLENTGQMELEPSVEGLVAQGIEKSVEDAEFNVISATFSAYDDELCDTGISVISTIQLRDPITHTFQAGYRVEIDIDNDGVYDLFMQNLNDRGRETAFPGRSRTLIGGIIDGVDEWRWGTPMGHSAGSKSVQLSGCSEFLGIDASLLGESINIRASVGVADWQSGVFFETDSIEGSTVFGSQPTVSFISVETGEQVNKLQPGEKAIVEASGSFLLVDDFSDDVVQTVTSEIMQLPDIQNPVIIIEEFSVSEDAANDTVIGQLTTEELEFGLSIAEFYVQSNTHTGLTVDANGKVIVTNTELLKGDSTAEIQVVAIDVRGNVSEPALLTVAISKVVPPVVTPEPTKSSSGSLAWLTLLAAPFALFRRRKQK